MSVVQLEQGSAWNIVTRCTCGAERKPWRVCCVTCSNRNRKRHSALPCEAKRKANARSYLNVYLRRGKIVKLPCAACGAVMVEAHHADYSKPLDVVWLCRPCHEKKHGVVVDRITSRTCPADHGRPPELYEFYRLLHAREMSTTKLAAALGRSHPTISRVINGSRRRGPVWPKIAALLLPEELSALEAAHKSGWASERAKLQPKWTPEKAGALTP